MSKYEKIVDLQPRIARKAEFDEWLKWERLLDSMAATPPVINAEIATTLPATTNSKWKKFDNMATLKKLMQHRKKHGR